MPNKGIGGTGELRERENWGNERIVGTGEWREKRNGRIKGNWELREPLRERRIEGGNRRSNRRIEGTGELREQGIKWTGQQENKGNRGIEQGNKGKRGIEATGKPREQGNSENQLLSKQRIWGNNETQGTGELRRPWNWGNRGSKGAGQLREQGKELEIRAENSGNKGFKGTKQETWT